MQHLSYSVRCALVIDLLKQLHKNGSWCGETHVQKAMYISQDLAKATFGYKFIMYRHGPFSFDLKEELSAMRASNIIEFVFPQKEYGPSIRVTNFGDRVYDTNRENIEAYHKFNAFVAKWFSGSDVRNLEKIATAYFITKRNPRAPVAERAKQIHGLKPHVDLLAAEEAVKTVDQKREEAKREVASAA
jgi:hypothetical protein